MPHTTFFLSGLHERHHSIFQLSLLVNITKPLDQKFASSRRKTIPPPFYHISSPHSMDREYFQHATQEGIFYARRLVSSTIAIVLYVFVITYTFSAGVPSALAVVMAIMSVVGFSERGLSTTTSGDVAFRTLT